MYEAELETVRALTWCRARDTTTTSRSAACFYLGVILRASPRGKQQNLHNCTALAVEEFELPGRGHVTLVSWCSRSMCRGGTFSTREACLLLLPATRVTTHQCTGHGAGLPQPGARSGRKQQAHPLITAHRRENLGEPPALQRSARCHDGRAPLVTRATHQNLLSD